MLGDEREQARGRIGPVNRPRGALEVGQHFDEYGRPIRRADGKKFSDTDGRMRHGRRKAALIIQDKAIGLQIKWAARA